MTTILQDIKQILGVSKDDDSFDTDILLYINATMSILSDLGLKEADNQPIISYDDIWEDFLGDRKDLEFVKSYIGFKTKMMFDPPTSSAAMESYNRLINELEWRIHARGSA